MPIGDRDEAGVWLATGLCLSRVVPWGEDELGRVGPWLLATIGERLDLPPVGVVADIGSLLHGAHVASHATRRLVGDPRLDTALRRYEDGVLVRLDADPRMAAGADAIARLSPELRALGVGIFVASMLARLGFDRGVTLQPGIVRGAMRRPAREMTERGFVALRDPTATREAVTAAYESLVRGAQRAGQLVSEADVFALENLTVLRSLTQRLAIGQVVEAQEAIARGFPRRIRSTRKSAGTTATRLEDETEYPVGGFSSISTSGTLENLVTSELIYMESPEPAGAARARTVDLFDMRYTEGELLYYTRDEAIFTRQRRLIVFLLGNDLASTRVKDVALPWQRGVLLLGLVMATLKKLTDELAGEALEFRVVFIRDSPEQPSALRAERELSELALREWRDRGVVAIEEGTLASEARTLTAASRRAMVEVVMFSSVDAATALEAWRTAASVAKLPPATPCVVATTGLGQAADLESWREAAVDLVAGLL